MLEVFLNVVFVFMAGAVCLAGVAQFWQWFYATPTDQDETVYIRTADGWRLALHRYGAQEDSKGLPVILCHGLSSNRYAFDMPTAPSLARFLRARGRNVWVAELRGSGMSQGPGLRSSDSPYSWGFEDHLQEDVPAIIRYVLDRTGARAVHWVGHSMGGMLILAHLARHPKSSLASVVTLGSPVAFSKVRNKAFDRLLAMTPLVRHFPVFPLPFFGRVISPLAHVMPHALLGLFYRPNITPEAARRVLALASQVVTSTRLWLDFGRFLSTGAFADKDGRPYLQGIEKAEVPILLGSGAKDVMAPPEAVIAALDVLRDDRERSCVVFGKVSGCAEDYGHMDLLVGARSEREIFPSVLRWVADHDEVQPQEAVA